MRKLLPVMLVVTVVAASGLFFRSKERSPVSGGGHARRQRVAAQAYGRLPLGFEPNLGQTSRRVKFLSRGNGFGLFLTSTRAVLALPGTTATGEGVFSGRIPSFKGQYVGGAILGMRLVGADPRAQMSGNDRLQGVSNYLIGKDPNSWRLGVPRYAQVNYRDIYPRVSLTYYGNQGGQLEYDFTLAPAADPSLIGLAFSGANGVSLDPSGDLVLHLPGGDLRQPAPVMYQLVDGKRWPVSGGYIMTGSSRVGFHVGAYNPTLPLVIDPTISYSTYLGGSDLDRLQGAVLDQSGNVYLTGITSSLDYPTTPGAFQTSFRASTGSCHNGTADTDAFVTKLNATGTGLVYSTYLGGAGSDCAIGIDIDPSGNAYVSGMTDSTNFPTTAGTFQQHYGGGPLDGFVTKLNPSGSGLVFSTLIGGSGDDRALTPTVDAARHIFIEGATSSTNFPTTAGAFQTSFAGGFSDAFVAKLNRAGSRLIYSTYVGGNDFDFAFGISGTIGGVDSAGEVYFNGDTLSANFPTTTGAFQTSFQGGPGFFPSDAYVAKLNAAGSGLIYSTYVGGAGFEDVGDMTADPSGNLYMAGTTGSTHFPTTTGAFQTSYQGGRADGFLIKLNPSGSALLFSTYLGSTGFDSCCGVRTDPAGNAFLAGATDSKHFPVTADAFQPIYGGGPDDAFLIKLDASGSGLSFSSFLGGSGDEELAGVVGLDQLGDVFVAGRTTSPDFTTTAGAFQTSLGGGIDNFVVKVSF